MDEERVENSVERSEGKDRSGDAVAVFQETGCRRIPDLLSNVQGTNAASPKSKLTITNVLLLRSMPMFSLTSPHKRPRISSLSISLQDLTCHLRRWIWGDKET